jgi:RNA polymerase sigma factor (sigma-70 family)
MAEEIALLREYATTRSQQAFAQLAERYVDVVYAAARRQVRDAHLAEDVTQAVFIVLSKRAAAVPTDRPLTAWLLMTTRYCASNMRRMQARRASYEQRAAQMAPTQSDDADNAQWTQLTPLLDEAIARLGERDRNAIVLKYFEHKSLRQVGEVLGVSEDAAAKRVSRAVEKLRDFLQRRGATVSTMSLGALLMSESARAAPPGLASAVGAAGTSAGGSAIAATAAKGAMVAMAMHKTIVLVAAGILLLLGIGGGAMYLQSIGARRTARTIDIPAVPPPKIPQGSGVTFSDGTTVQILGMAEVFEPGVFAGPLGFGKKPATQPVTWWGPDGATVPAVPMRGLGNVSAGAGFGQRQIRLIIAQRNPVPSDNNVTVQVEGSGGGAESTNTRNGETLMNLATAVPSDVDRTAIRFGLAKGAWREDASIAPATTTQPTTQTTGAKVFKSIGEDQGDCVVEIDQRQAVADRQRRVVAVLQNGKIVNSSEWRGYPDGRGVVKFPCRKDQVAKITWDSRPYEWVKLPDVALFPKTNPTTLP